MLQYPTKLLLHCFLDLTFAIIFLSLEGLVC